MDMLRTDDFSQKLYPQMLGSDVLQNVGHHSRVSCEARPQYTLSECYDYMFGPIDAPTRHTSETNQQYRIHLQSADPFSGRAC